MLLHVTLPSFGAQEVQSPRMLWQVARGKLHEGGQTVSFGCFWPGSYPVAEVEGCEKHTTGMSRKRGVEGVSAWEGAARVIVDNSGSCGRSLGSSEAGERRT